MKKTTTGVVRATIFLTLVFAILLTVGTALVLNQAEASSLLTDRRHQVEAIAEIPIATSGDNVYMTWWTNKSGNNEVMFRTSTDGGTTFEDKINLSNTTDAESVDANVEASGDSVYVTWWERNQTANDPVARISTDNGETFGPLLKLAVNGTIGEDEDEVEVEEE